MREAIRPATAEDGEALDGRGMVRRPDEHASDGAAYLKRIGFGRPRSQHWVAELDGSVVGEASAKTLGLSGCAHVAMLAVQVHPRAQRRGLGRALMQTALDWCVDNEIVRVQLYMRADNDRAFALYRSLGFELESTRRRFLRHPDGSYADDLVLVRFLDEA